MATPTTKPEILREIERLKALADGLPDAPARANNHPGHYQVGQIYQQREGDVYMTYISHHNNGDRCYRLVCVSGSEGVRPGTIWSTESLFGNHANSFTYLGMAGDVLAVRAEADDDTHGCNWLPMRVRGFARVLAPVSRWVAMDRDGWWCAFDVRPTIGADDCWHAGTKTQLVREDRGSPFIDWMRSLVDMEKP